MVKKLALSSAALGVLLVAQSALAQQEPEAQKAAVARVHHAPISTAIQGNAIEIHASIEHPERVRSAGVVYRTSDGKSAEAPLLRSGDGYVAVVPPSDVHGSTLGYDIEIEGLDGARTAVFASRESPFQVEVMEPRMDEHERALLERLHGRRSVATASSDVVSFGTTTGTSKIPCGAGVEGCPLGSSRIPSVADQYWRVEMSYTYRPLRAIAEFSIRGGVVRGSSLVDETTIGSDKNKVGLNYGAPTVRFRLADAWHIEGELLTSITEVGFSVGTGAALLIGDPYASHLTLGWETIGLDPSTYFGSRFYSRVDVVANERLTVAPMVEVTDMPHADSFGVRLLGEADITLGRGFGLGLRAGYQARRSVSGGPSFGGHMALAF
jgi:hypothetical protein